MASNKLRAASQDHGEAAEMDMSPMIDMVFLLLLFFLVVSNPKTIKIDAEVKPPVAKYGGTPETVRGKIVINVYKDGSFKDESQEKTFDGDDLAPLTEYIKEQKEEIKLTGNTPILHIRADKRVEFKHCQRVIKAGGDAGVQQLAYASLNKSK